MDSITAGALVVWNDHPYLGMLAIGIVSDLVLCAPLPRIDKHSAWINQIQPERFVESNDVVLFAT